MHCRGECAERLVRADIGSGFLATDVLLASGQRQYESAAAFGIGGLARETAGHLPHEFIAGGDDACEWATITWREAEALRFHGDDVGFGGRMQQAELDTFRDGRHEQG